MINFSQFAISPNQQFYHKTKCNRNSQRIRCMCATVLAKKRNSVDDNVQNRDVSFESNISIKIYYRIP